MSPLPTSPAMGRRLPPSSTRPRSRLLADSSATLRRSPLDGWHRDHGARLVGFGGWEMPLEFSVGTLAEHMACRRETAIFDVSHLGTVRVSGGRRRSCLTTGPHQQPGQDRSWAGASTPICSMSRVRCSTTSSSGGCEDQRFDVMPNASNTSRVLGAIGGHDVTGERAVLAVQGPRRGPLWPEFSRKPRRSLISASRPSIGGVRPWSSEARGIRARTVSSVPCRPVLPPSSGKPS